MGAAGSVNNRPAGRRVTCHTCGQQLQIPNSVSANHSVGCPRCGNIVIQGQGQQHQHHVHHQHHNHGPNQPGRPPQQQQQQQGRQQTQQTQQQVVGCPHCRRHLLPPPGAPRFRCPCGRILEMSVGHNFLLHQASQPAPQQQSTTLVRCPRCSLLLRAPPGAPQFRCPCGILLALQNNGNGRGNNRISSWQCHLCSHTNSARIGACVMCGAQKQLGNSAGSKSTESSADAFRLRRANQLRKSKRQWKRQRGQDGTYTWVRQMEEEEVNINIGAIEIEGDDELSKMSANELKARIQAMGFEYDDCIEKKDLVERCIEAHHSVNDLSVTDLKTRLDVLNVDHSQCIEKTELVRKLRRESTKRGKLETASAVQEESATEAGWVRQIGIDGRITLVPASGQKVHGTGGVGMNIQEDDMEGAAALPFENKVRYFNLFLQHKVKVAREHGVVKVQVRRDSILQDSFGAILRMKPDDFRRAFMYEFQHEQGLDYGGVSREYYTLLFNEIFNVDFGLFHYSAVSNLSFSINPNSGVANELHLDYFRFVGRILAKAMLDGYTCPHHLSLPLYKHIIGFPVGLSDVEYVDTLLGKTLRQVLDIDDNEVEAMCLDFTATVTSFGKTMVQPLKQNGENIDVTPENRNEYVKLMIQYMLLHRVNGQLGMFLKGFYEIIPQNLISIFDFQELELLVCGLPSIDLGDWKENTVYKGAFATKKENHKVVKWFWKAAGEYSQEQRARLLQFITGTSRVPVQGFQGLQGNDGTLRPFTIDHIALSTSRFPRAHTCFNRIDLPLYETEEELRACLDGAIHQECFFGIE